MDTQSTPSFNVDFTKSKPIQLVEEPHKSSPVNSKRKQPQAEVSSLSKNITSNEH